MRNALRNRIDQNSEDGFTLIELMVVVLIIGILLAIAIPTFLGARDRANDRSAQSNLRNALTAEKTLYTDTQTYTATAGTGAAALSAVEPSLNWATAVSATNPRAVVATLGGGGATATTVILENESATGTCFWMADVAAPGSNPGTYYAASSGCVAPTIDPSAQAAPPPHATPAPATAGIWSQAF